MLQISDICTEIAAMPQEQVALPLSLVKERAQMRQVKRSTRVAVLLASVLWLASGAFVWLHATRPSDGVRLEPGKPVWQPNGVMVTPLTERSSELRPGDVVIAVAGQRMEAWAQALLRWSAPRPRWELGQVVPYTVLRNGEQLNVEVTLGRYPLGAVLAKNWSIILFALIAQLITLFVLLRRSDDVAVRALFVWAWSLSAAITWLFGLHVQDLVGGSGFWLYTFMINGAWFLSWGSILHFALVFPQPHPLMTRRPWSINLVYGAPYLIFLIHLALTWSLASSILDWLGWWRLSGWYIALIYLAVASIVIVQQYRASRGGTRQKLRWLAFAALLSIGGCLLLWFLPGILLGHSLISNAALGLLVLPYPLALAVALLRYQLFDIDIIIRRTLVYGVLTLTLAMLYFASVFLLQQAFRRWAGQEQNQIVTVLSTLAIAALFTPLRRHVQEAIDRRFYRRTYDAEQVLAAFSALARNETDLDSLSNRLVAVVEEAMQPTQVSIWLRKTTKETRQEA